MLVEVVVVEFYDAEWEDLRLDDINLICQFKPFSLESEQLSVSSF